MVHGAAPGAEGETEAQRQRALSSPLGVAANEVKEEGEKGRTVYVDVREKVPRDFYLKRWRKSWGTPGGVVGAWD